MDAVTVPYWVYILLCADGSYYTGHTDDLELRLAQHFQGDGSGYTRKQGVRELVYAKQYPSRGDALAIEQQIKGWSRAKKRALIDSDWKRLHELARSYGSRGSAAGRPL